MRAIAAGPKLVTTESGAALRSSQASMSPTIESTATAHESLAPGQGLLQLVRGVGAGLG